MDKDGADDATTVNRPREKRRTIGVDGKTVSAAAGIQSSGAEASSRKPAQIDGFPSQMAVTDHKVRKAARRNGADPLCRADLPAGRKVAARTACWMGIPKETALRIQS